MPLAAKTMLYIGASRDVCQQVNDIVKGIGISIQVYSRARDLELALNAMLQRLPSLREIIITISLENGNTDKLIELAKNLHETGISVILISKDISLGKRITEIPLPFIWSLDSKLQQLLLETIQSLDTATKS